MMIRFFPMAFAVTLAAGGWAGDAVLTNMAEIAALSDAEITRKRPFDLTGKIIHMEPCLSIPEEPGPRFSFWLSTENHAMLVHGLLPAGAHTGDCIRITGEMHLDSDQYRYATAHTATNVPNAKTSELAFRPFGAIDLANPVLNDRLVALSATVTEAFTDEIDPQYTYLELDLGGGTLHAAINSSMLRPERLRAIVGAAVRITGVYNIHAGSLRRHMGPLLRIFGQDDISIVRPASDDPYDFPECPSAPFLSPHEIRSWGKRRMTGEVLATWQGNQMLLRTSDGNMHHVELAHGCALPKPGGLVTAGGQCQTDFYHINLTRAICRTEIPSAPLSHTLPGATLTNFLHNIHGGIDIRNYGRLACVHGTVTHPPATGIGKSRLYLNCEHAVIPVDLSTTGGQVDDYPVGSTVDATGVCLMEIDNWRSGDSFPRIRSVTIVARTPEDIRLVARPPWWTPRRMLAVIGSLFAALCCIFVWNRVLGAVIDRRSRELLRERVAHAMSEFKVGERTRLAVELHDTLSQNLAGVACQVTAAQNVLGENPNAALRLATAERMLLSCRTELRRCLSDLRGNALEETRFDEALEKTLRPVVGKAALSIRFTVPRARLTDVTAHATLCIIRELASNAVRHGGATSVSVEGTLEGNRLRFSVRNDGRIFDPENCPGPAEGHFGLTGIRERIEKLGGTFTILPDNPVGMRTDVTLELQTPANIPT